MFTTKHHSGFAMFDTTTTPFGIMNTPFHRDITKEVFDAFRSQGIATGVYYSPDDFWWLHQNGKTIERSVPGVQPRNNPGLMEYDQTQLRELLTHYGKIDALFLDGEAVGLRDLAWKLDPEIIVTRGAIKTPELTVPGMPLPGAWETCMTMGTSWQYQPQNEHYKSGGELIRLLIQTRAKGGNFLLNVGPKPNGELPIEEEERLREIALWMFVNSDAIYAVRPWVITNEGDIWFTKKKDSQALYAIVESDTPWPRATWKEFTLHSVRATSKTEVSVLGQSDQVVEYHPEIKPKSSWHQEKDGLHVRVMQTQRLQDNFHWPNPAVLKITNAEPALTPPHVQTTGSVAESSVSRRRCGARCSIWATAHRCRSALNTVRFSVKTSTRVPRPGRRRRHRPSPSPGLSQPISTASLRKASMSFAPSFTIRCWRSTVRRSPCSASGARWRVMPVKLVFMNVRVVGGASGEPSPEESVWELENRPRIGPRPVGPVAKLCSRARKGWGSIPKMI